MKLTIRVPAGFNFWRTVYSHGWATLQPFGIGKSKRCLRRTLEISGGNIINVLIKQKSNGLIMIMSDRSTMTNEMKEIKRQIISCLRIDEDFSEFYGEARKYPKFRWIAHSGVGRLLRAPTVYEDVIKMICTTNCSWALTEVMVNNLCHKLGKRAGENQYTFPTPSAVSICTEKFIRKEIRAGYRAPYILELSRNISDGKRDVEKWRSSDLSTVDLYNEIRSIKGVGPYAAANILKLVGRYDYLGIDSWCRKTFAGMHGNNRRVNDRIIEQYYAPFGKWKGLFFWLDLTKHWQNEEYPF